jgi:hypothetical protein
VNAVGESALSAQVSATPATGSTAPLPPAGVTAVAADIAVTVSWKATTGATSYNLYWSVSSPVTTASAKIVGASAPFVHSPLTNGTTYYYAVTAVNAVGESALSAEVSATPPGGILLAGLFPDANLAACITAWFPRAITTTQVTGYLECAFKNISNLSGMENLTGLVSINLFGNQITNVTPLGSIKGVALLDLGSNQIANVTPLTTLPALTMLAVDGNMITDAKVAQLATITNLTWLHLRSNLVTNIAPLASLTNLTDLWLGANNITNLAPLAGLTGLVQLELYGNNISNVAPLAGLTALTYLTLANNQIVDVSPLATLTRLTYLDIPFNLIGGAGVGKVSSLLTLTTAQIYLTGNIGMSCQELNTLICGPGNAVLSTACLPNSTGLGMNVEISGNALGNLDMPTNGFNCTSP